MEPTQTEAGAEPRPTRVNGIDTKAFFEIIDAVRRDPAQGMCQFSATTRWRHGTFSSTEISHYRLGGQEIPQAYDISTDEPAALLGTDGAPNPQMLLYAALNACVLNSFVVVASAKGLRIENLEIDLEGELDLRGFLGIDPSINPGYDELTLVCRVSGDGTREQYQQCLEAATRLSPNFQTISRAVRVGCRIETH